MLANADLLGQLANLSEEISFNEFNATVAALYRYDVGGIEDGVTEEEFLSLTGDGNTPDERLTRLMIKEEIGAFSAYLRTVHRNRGIFNKLVAKMNLDNG